MWEELDKATIKAFDGKFKKGVEYARAQIDNDLEELRSAGLPLGVQNVTAYSYNRWNCGMDRPRNLFERSGRGRYKYLGANYPYSGETVHHPQGGAEQIIGKWENGKFTFNEGYKSFAEWREAECGR